MFQVASGQGNHWLIESSTVVSPVPDICVLPLLIRCLYITLTRYMCVFWLYTTITRILPIKIVHVSRESWWRPNHHPPIRHATHHGDDQTTNTSCYTSWWRPNHHPPTRHATHHGDDQTATHFMLYVFSTLRTDATTLKAGTKCLRSVGVSATLASQKSRLAVYRLVARVNYLLHTTRCCPTNRGKHRSFKQALIRPTWCMSELFQVALL